jgi:isoleucyl-tRNA synthetase
MFKNVSPKLDVVKMEEAVLGMWKDKDVFHKSVKQREGGKSYVFFEGPPHR